MNTKAKDEGGSRTIFDPVFADDAWSGIAPPKQLEIFPFGIGAEEYVVLTFQTPSASRELPASVRLTPSERAIVRLIRQGSSNAEIAAIRGTAASTVANQLFTIYRKLGVRSRRELIALENSA